MTSYPEHLRAMVEQYLDALDFAPDPPDGSGLAEGTGGLVDAMRYSLLAGGKRIRPVLCLATCEGLGHEPEELLPTAAALELIHTYSLIHDDLPSMDDDDLRRGRPTCHRAFGEDTAILAGDALFAEAIRLVTARQTGPATARLAIVTELTTASGVNGMVGGQYLDLGEYGRQSAEALRHVHLLKTGRLIAAAVRCAVIYAQPEPEVELALRAYATELGLLFQIVDDILDVSGDEDAMGKPVGADERRGKITYASFYGLERAKELAAESHDRAEALLAAVAGPTDDLAALTNLIFARQS